MGHTLRCPICGTRLDTAQQQACSGCPLGRSCRLICCPQCGFSIPRPDAPSWAGRLRSIFIREPKHDTPHSTH